MAGERLPQVRGARTWVWIARGASQSTLNATVGWQSWLRPPNVSMLWITCIGGGGGGGGGFQAATLAARGGGAGGGSGAISNLIIPAIFLPRQLFVRPGPGGAAGPKNAGAGTPGKDGTSSFVSASRDNTIANVVLSSAGSNGPATGGAPGDSAGTAAAGTGEDIMVATRGGYIGFGIFSALAGQNGGNGAPLSSAPSDLTWGSNGLPISGGAGGASMNTNSSTDTAGAGIVVTSTKNLIKPVSGGTAGGGAGGQGYSLKEPFLAIGGGGGATSAAGTGGTGGAGGIGCGGGGGGPGVTGAPGGDGGPGMIVIVAW